MTTPLRLATRASPLALWQADHVTGLLQAIAPDLAVVQVRVETTGDQNRDRPLSQIGGDGLFTKQIQIALQENRADLAVHSLKDLPTTTVEGLTLAAVPPRGPVGDVLVSPGHRSFEALPRGAVVATSSLRRRAQLLWRRPDLRIVDIRGNVETRLAKLTEEPIDALVLAQAGLERLARGQAITEILDPQWMLPAVGQGALGLECRGEDGGTLALVARIDHLPTSAAVRAERAFLQHLGGGCQVPIGAATSVEGQMLTLRGAVLQPDGSRRIAAKITGPLANPEMLGRQLADDLMEKGARDLLQRAL
jgi:hydroxymethylbilane synthase